MPVELLELAIKYSLNSIINLYRILLHCNILHKILIVYIYCLQPVVEDPKTIIYTFTLPNVMAINCSQFMWWFFNSVELLIFVG